MDSQNYLQNRQKPSFKSKLRAMFSVRSIAWIAGFTLVIGSIIYFTGQQGAYKGLVVIKPDATCEQVITTFNALFDEFLKSNTTTEAKQNYDAYKVAYDNNSHMAKCDNDPDKIALGTIDYNFESFFGKIQTTCNSFASILDEIEKNFNAADAANKQEIFNEYKEKLKQHAGLLNKEVALIEFCQFSDYSTKTSAMEQALSAAETDASTFDPAAISFGTGELFQNLGTQNIEAFQRLGECAEYIAPLQEKLDFANKSTNPDNKLSGYKIVLDYIENPIKKENCIYDIKTETTAKNEIFKILWDKTNNVATCNAIKSFSISDYEKYLKYTFENKVKDDLIKNLEQRIKDREVELCLANIPLNITEGITETMTPETIAAVIGAAETGANAQIEDKCKSDSLKNILAGLDKILLEPLTVKNQAKVSGILNTIKIAYKGCGVDGKYLAYLSEQIEDDTQDAIDQDEIEQDEENQETLTQEDFDQAMQEAIEQAIAKAADEAAQKAAAQAAAQTAQQSSAFQYQQNKAAQDMIKNLQSEIEKLQKESQASAKKKTTLPAWGAEGEWDQPAAAQPLQPVAAQAPQTAQPAVTQTPKAAQSTQSADSQLLASQTQQIKTLEQKIYSLQKDIQAQKTTLSKRPAASKLVKKTTGTGPNALIYLFAAAASFGAIRYLRRK